MKTNLAIGLFVLAAITVFAGDYDHYILKAAIESRDKGQKLGRCLTHKRPMVQQRVPIVYAYNDTAPSDAVPWEVRIRQFPHARHVAIRTPPEYIGAPKKTSTYVCPDCEAAEKRWQEEHAQ